MVNGAILCEASFNCISVGTEIRFLLLSSHAFFTNHLRNTICKTSMHVDLEFFSEFLVKYRNIESQGVKLLQSLLIEIRAATSKET